MRCSEFRNALCILRSTDRHEVDATLGRPMTGEEWQAFRSNPSLFFLRADDQMMAAIWAVIEARSAPVRRSA
jgi:hypothetical protein